jgi:hypothetical protein
LKAVFSTSLRTFSAKVSAFDTPDLGQDDGELLAAVARHDVLAPDARLEHRGQLLEHVVAGQVAVGVVDLLEVSRCRT